MFKRTRVVALNGGFVAQIKHSIFGDWASFYTNRSGDKSYQLTYVIANCLHDSVDAAKATLLLMTEQVVK